MRLCDPQQGGTCLPGPASLREPARAAADNQQQRTVCQMCLFFHSPLYVCPSSTTTSFRLDSRRLQGGEQWRRKLLSIPLGTPQGMGQGAALYEQRVGQAHSTNRARRSRLNGQEPRPKPHPAPCPATRRQHRA